MMFPASLPISLRLLVLPALLNNAAHVLAGPIPVTVDEKFTSRSASVAVTALSATTLANFAPFTQFARAAYCQPSTTQNWTCGGV